MLPTESEELTRYSRDGNAGVSVPKAGGKAVPDGDHAEIIRWIARQTRPLRGELWLCQEFDIEVDTYHNGRARVTASRIGTHMRKLVSEVHLLIDRASGESIAFARPEDGV